MQPLALMLFGPVGTTEIIVVVGVLLLFFGGRKIPELAKGLGRGITEFRRGLQDPGSGKDKGGSGELPREASSSATPASNSSSEEPSKKP